MIIGLCIGTVLFSTLMLKAVFAPGRWQFGQVAMTGFVFLAGGAALGYLIERSA